jgi:hypothetical protein
MIEGTTDPRNVKIQYFFNFKLIKSRGMMINNIYFYRRGVYSVILKLKWNLNEMLRPDNSWRLWSLFTIQSKSDHCFIDYDWKMSKQDSDI